MKKMNQIVALVLIGISFVAANSHARSLHPDTFAKKAELVTWNFAKNSILKNQEILGGVVKVNNVTKQASILFELANNCPPNAYCIEIVRAHTLELPIVSVKKNSCGEITYTAEKNMMPVDGLHKKLEIRDTTFSVCDIVYPAATMIKYSEKFYDRIQGKLIERTSHLTADQLL